MPTPKLDYEISFASPDDLNEVQTFIHKYWRADHIMASDARVFHWQHWNRREQRYNFVLARRLIDREIIGVLGYIASDQFDDVKGTFRAVWLAIWKVREDLAKPGLGMILREFIVDHEKPDLIASVGLNPKTFPIYRYLGYKTGKLDHFVCVNESREDFEILSGWRREFAGKHRGESDKTVQLSEVTLAQLDDVWQAVAKQIEVELVPTKSKSYIKERYLQHPSYHYHLVKAEDQNGCVSLLVTRVQTKGDAQVLRIVDWVGSRKIGSGWAPTFQALMARNNFEYIDLMCFGFDKALLQDAGFSDVSACEGVVVPNYFEPFVAENKDVHFAYLLQSELHYLSFKGDADQDRPSQPVGDSNHIKMLKL